MPGCTLEAAHTQKTRIRHCSHHETAVRQLFTSLLAGALLCINAPSVGMVMSMRTHPSTSAEPPKRGLIDIALCNTSRLLL